ncbi:MAG: AAA family ATPase [Candidatus Shapirobacteria bacterium]|nr:AAA family ATPase [Candidatus Shapirobacteria bacterium]
MSTVPTLIIVTGIESSGKSFIASELSRELNLPFFSKDIIKEKLFDTIGYKDRDWSKKLGIGSLAILFQTAEELLSHGQSLILESNFKPELAKIDFENIAKKIPIKFFQIVCFADGQEIYKRFIERVNSGKRHPGHRDDINSIESKDRLLKGGKFPINIPGEKYEIDTTDFSKVDLKPLILQLQNYLKN